MNIHTSFTTAATWLSIFMAIGNNYDGDSFLPDRGREEQRGERARGRGRERDAPSSSWALKRTTTVRLYRGWRGTRTHRAVYSCVCTRSTVSTFKYFRLLFLEGIPPTTNNRREKQSQTESSDGFLPPLPSLFGGGRDGKGDIDHSMRTH